MAIQWRQVSERRWRAEVGSRHLLINWTPDQPQKATHHTEMFSLYDITDGEKYLGTRKTRAAIEVLAEEKTR